jgi:hypothetical protein
MSESRRKFRLLPFVTLALALISLGCFAVPMYVIWPFRHQGATELRMALLVKDTRMDVALDRFVLVAADDGGWISDAPECI